MDKCPHCGSSAIEIQQYSLSSSSRPSAVGTELVWWCRKCSAGRSTPVKKYLTGEDQSWGVEPRE